MKSFLKIGIIGALMMLATPVFSQVHIGLGIRIGPPPPRREVIVVRPYRDAVWIPGYYRWIPRRHHYVWIHGYWVRRPHPHAVWVPGRWERRHDEWIFFEGRWNDEDAHARPQEHRHERERREGSRR